VENTSPQPLTNGTAAGGVMEFPVPLTMLSEQAPNRLEVRFTMRSASQPAAAPSDLFSRLDGQTMVHYQLAVPGGGRAAGLETYPFSLLAAGGVARNLGVVLPGQPEPGEMGSALRVLADIGFRAGALHPTARLISSDSATWLSKGGQPAIVIGRLDRLPSPALIDAAGWKRADKGLNGPDGRALALEDGLVTTFISPWDHHSPLVLVTGATDGALAKAVAALVGTTGLPVANSYAVATRQETDTPAPVESVPINLNAPKALLPTEPARYRTSMSFAAPPADPESTGQLELRLPSFRSAAAKPTFLVAELNGQRVGGTGLDPAGPDPRQLDFNFPGSVLRPGNNAVTVEFQLRAPGSAQASEQGIIDDSLSGSLSLPRLPSQNSDLRTLPYPFFESVAGHKTLVALTDGSAATLDAAGQAMVALGTRSSVSPPPLEVAVKPSVVPRGSDLVVVGAAPSSGDLARIAGTLPLSVTDSVGTLQQTSMSATGGNQVLWVGGRLDTLPPAARALADSQIRGHAVTVDAAGHIRPAQTPDTSSPIVRLSVPKLLAILAGVLLTLTLALQLVRPRAVPTA
jgi:Bacterial cellulose synthase subunit